MSHKVRMVAWHVAGYADNLDKKEPEEQAAACHFTRPGDDLSNHGWVRVGEADVVMHLYPRSVRVQGEVASLNEKIKTVRADAEEKVAHLQNAINNLLALSYEDDDTMETNDETQ